MAYEEEVAAKRGPVAAVMFSNNVAEPEGTEFLDPPPPASKDFSWDSFWISDCKLGGNNLSVFERDGELERRCYVLGRWRRLARQIRVLGP